MKHSLQILSLVCAGMLLCSCAKDNAGHYVYIGPSVGANVGYNGVSVGVALYGPNPSAANVTVTSNATPTPNPTPPITASK